MKHHIPLFLMLFLVASCQQQEHAQNPDIDTIFQSYDTKTSPGCAVAVVQNGGVVFKKGYGLANLEYDIAISPTTIFDIASVSKQFAGLAISTLVEEGKIALDDDIRKYLPEVPDFGKTITIRHLVHHTSGLRDWPQALNVAGWRWDETFSFQDIMRMVRFQTELDFEPGEKYMYSNTGYNLLAELVARVSGKSFREWTEVYIFKPLQMNASQFLEDHRKVIRNLAYSYARSGDEFTKSPSALTALGSSSLFTNVEDLSLWVIHFQKEVVAKNPVYLRMLEEGVLNNGDKTGYGFGLGIGKSGGLATVAHTGGWAGYRTAILNFPEENLSCIILGNTSDFDSYGKALDVARVFLKEKYIEETGTSNAKELPTVTVSEALAQKCVGMYQLRPGWYVTITLEEGRLMTQANGEAKFPMEAKSDTVYWIDAYHAAMTFVPDKNGEVNALRYKAIKSAPRIKPATIDSTQFGSYAGTYYSRELAAEYKVDFLNNKLMIHHMRLGDFELLPDPAIADQFSSTVAFIRFIRNDEKKVTGLTMSGGRVKNLRFDRR